MNKSELIRTLAEETDLPFEDASLVVNTFFDAMKESLIAGERIEIRGFGKAGGDDVEIFAAARRHAVKAVEGIIFAAQKLRAAAELIEPVHAVAAHPARGIEEVALEIDGVGVHGIDLHARPGRGNGLGKFGAVFVKCGKEHLGAVGAKAAYLLQRVLGGAARKERCGRYAYLYHRHIITQAAAKCNTRRE